MKNCPICSVGTLEDLTGDNDGLLLEYSLCSHCGSEIADKGQIDRNAARNAARSLRIRLEEYAKTIPSANIESILESDRNSAGIKIPSWKKF